MEQSILQEGVRVTLPRDLRAIVDEIPKEDLPVGDDYYQFMVAFFLEFMACFEAATRAKGTPQVIFNQMRKSGTQYIWEFYVNDLAKPRGDSINWHGQNTSQWLYAGCILLQDKKVSRHH